MKIDEFKGYFETEYRGISSRGTYLHIIAKRAFPNAKVDSIREITSRSPIYKDLALAGGVYSVIISLECTDHDKAEIEAYILSLLEELNDNVANIGKIIIDDSEMHEEEKAAEEEFRQLLESVRIKMENEPKPDLDTQFGIDKLGLNYNAHLVELYNECFLFNIRFPSGADEEELQAVKDVIERFDFQLEDTDHVKYIEYMLDNGEVLVNLDRGGMDPQKEKKVFRGILLALNGIKDLAVKDISQVVINDF
ncbi:MAG: hypothetical protein J5685_07850 [Clostridiales bacterium]|nr:hypothetical protein [Clostridiales bacterium]